MRIVAGADHSTQSIRLFKAARILYNIGLYFSVKIFFGSFYDLKHTNQIEFGKKSRPCCLSNIFRVVQSETRAQIQCDYETTAVRSLSHRSHRFRKYFV